MQRLLSAQLILLIAFQFLFCVSGAKAQDTTLSVTDFGAIADDDIDDTDAFQQALDQATDGKWYFGQGTHYLGIRTVLVPSGIFLVKGLVIKKSYTRLRGMGALATVIKMSGGVGPVIYLKGAGYVEIERMALDGGETASYGVFAEDTGIQLAENGKPYDSASVHGTLNNVMIRGVKGNPGIGFANTGRAHSWRIIDSTFFENTVGVKLVDRAQHTQIIESSINGNYKQQLILGDGKAVLKDITVRDTNIEGRNVGTGELVLIDGVTPVNFDGVYFEGHRSVDAMDILTVNLPSIITMKGVYSNGGAENKPKASIVLRTETALSIEGATYINTQKVYEIGWRQGDPTWAKPEQSKVIVKNSRGPGIKRGLEINQGGASWDDGISLTQGKHTWDVVVGKEGILWFGYNRKAKVILLPDGEVRTLK